MDKWSRSEGEPEELAKTVAKGQIFSLGIAAEDNPRRIGYGLSWTPGRSSGGLAEVPLLPAGCLAVRRQVFMAAGGFNRGFRGYGHEDEEISLRLWLLRHQLVATGEFPIVHRTSPRSELLSCCSW